MKKTLFLLFISCFSFSQIQAQDVELETIETDSVKNEPTDLSDSTIKTTIDWLLNTPLNEKENQRHTLQVLFLKWVAETPKVMVELDADILTFMQTNPTLLMPYLCGWVDYCSNNNWQKSDYPLDETVAAIETTVAFYKKNELELQYDESIKEYGELIEKGKLKKNIDKMMKKAQKQRKEASEQKKAKN